MHCEIDLGQELQDDGGIYCVTLDIYGNKFGIGVKAAVEIQS